MIPKIIHYCWFGDIAKSEFVLKCIDSWKTYCSDFEIIEWNENNYILPENKYINDAYKEKKWAFVSDYVRLDVIYNYGGIYLDTDVELIKPLDELLIIPTFFGVESQNLNIATGLGFGSIAHNPIIKELLDMYKSISFYKKNKKLNLTSCPILLTDFFEKLGYVKNNKVQVIQGVTILTSDVLCPYNYKRGKLACDKNTISIHWYNASWMDQDDKKIHEMEVKIRKKIKGKIGFIICYFYRKLYRLRMKLKKS